MTDRQFSLITETVEEEARFKNLVLLCEASLKQESFRRHVDRVFENYIFSHDSKINMAVKAILYNCMVCEDDFEYDFNNKIWVRTSSDRYAFNEAMRKFNKILYHDRRFRGRIPWVVKNVKEYFKIKLVKKYYAATGTKPPEPKKPTATKAPATNTASKQTAKVQPSKPVQDKKPDDKNVAQTDNATENKPAEPEAQPDVGDEKEEELPTSS